MAHPAKGFPAPVEPAAVPLTTRSRDRVRRDWADRLGCAPTAFEQQGVTLAAATSDRTVRLLRRGDATVVAANPALRDALSSRTHAIARWPLIDADGLLERALEGHPERVATAHAPVVLAYVDAGSFTPVASDARLLDTEDVEAFDALRERIPAKEWVRASPTFRPDRTAGLFRDGELVAAATLGEGMLPDVGVVVAPAFRGEGIGRAVVSCVLEGAFERDGELVPQYRTPEMAAASTALAAALGFERWASEAVVVLED